MNTTKMLSSDEKTVRWGPIVKPYRFFIQYEIFCYAASGPFGISQKLELESECQASWHNAKLPRQKDRGKEEERKRGRCSWSLPRLSCCLGSQQKNHDYISKTCPTTSLIKGLSENQLPSGMERISVAPAGYIIA